MGQSARAVLPGTRAFDHITKPVREQVAHHVIDTTSVGLERIQETLQAQLDQRGGFGSASRKSAGLLGWPRGLP